MYRFWKVTKLPFHSYIACLCSIHIAWTNLHSLSVKNISTHPVVELKFVFISFSRILRFQFESFNISQIYFQKNLHMLAHFEQHRTSVYSMTYLHNWEIENLLIEWSDWYTFQKCSYYILSKLTVSFYNST